MTYCSFAHPPLIKPFCVDSHRNICFVKTSCIKSPSLLHPYHIMMNSFSKPYVLDPSGTAGPQLNARNEPVVPLVEPRVAPMLDERGSRPTIVAQIPPPLGRQARPQQGTLPLPQVCPDLLADKKITTRVSRISNFLSSETALSASPVSINGNGGHWPVLHEGDERDDRPSSQVPTSSPTGRETTVGSPPR